MLVTSPNLHEERLGIELESEKSIKNRNGRSKYKHTYSPNQSEDRANINQHNDT